MPLEQAKAALMPVAGQYDLRGRVLETPQQHRVRK
jgi:hypothetical protein